MSHINPLPKDVVAKKRDDLIDVLYDMSAGYLDDDGKEIEDYACTMSRIYSDGYRQLYSELYPILTAISGGDPDSLQPLTTNLVSLYRYVGSSEKWAREDPGLFGHLLKLSDHVNLEMQRMVERTANEEMFDELYVELSELYESSAESERKLRKAVRKIKNLQLELVSILAIFAAIVVAFSGGMSILGSALSGIGQADIQDLAFVTILCGIVLFNTVAFLMHVVFWIIRRLHESEDREDRLIDWKYILGFNVLLLVLLGITLCLRADGHRFFAPSARSSGDRSYNLSA